MLYYMQAREYLWELIEEVTGARLTISYGRVGGVKDDLTVGFAERMAKALLECVSKLTIAIVFLVATEFFVTACVM